MSKSEQAETPAGIPMQKAKPTTLIAGIVGVLVLGGLAVFTMAGGSSESKGATAEAEKLEASSKLDAEQRKAHLATTQKALAAAAAAEAQEKAAADAAAAQEAAAKQAEEENAASTQSASAAPAKKPVNKQVAKKKMDSLDALGADITGALK